MTHAVSPSARGAFDGGTTVGGWGDERKQKLDKGFWVFESIADFVEDALHEDAGRLLRLTMGGNWMKKKLPGDPLIKAIPHDSALLQ